MSTHTSRRTSSRHNPTISSSSSSSHHISNKPSSHTNQQQPNPSSSPPTSVHASAEGTGHPLKRVRRKDTIESLITRPPLLVRPALAQLRYHVLMDGLRVTPPQAPGDPETGLCAYRPYVWSILLRVSPADLPAEKYVALVRKGASPAYTKIRNDTFRTFTTDAVFRSRVSENALVRVLNAVAWQRHLCADPEQPAPAPEFLYVQGMNVLAAPFLYQCKTEAQAFALFYTFLSRDCPLYVVPTLEGAHTGLKLVDKCLEIIDPALFDHLQSKLLTAELYAFTSVLTFSAGTPPLSQALVLWDFLFAYGPHLNVLFVIAQLTLMRSHLFEAQSPMTLLRNFPPLQAQEIIKLAISFVPLLPDWLYDLLVRHPFDPAVSSQLAARSLRSRSSRINMKK
ncbi:uncharacterized protein SAPINGB_P004073 [Magnusiomyces paraingens]|uniref:Rab-GAP TBC domain-containing protein n=1 Tax=Magnusiomyces paraingens TaxID=2606893 RepID=A0A5E8BSM3_9ASCO|nr:uncharacterized protein SAPINGB_P004073 [Saprochaete ingens]VVT54433.1 unnamed protein product [Saprochaete ingens]